MRFPTLLPTMYLWTRIVLQEIMALFVSSYKSEIVCAISSNLRPISEYTSVIQTYKAHDA